MVKKSRICPFTTGTSNSLLYLVIIIVVLELVLCTIGQGDVSHGLYFRHKWRMAKPEACIVSVLSRAHHIVQDKIIGTLFLVPKYEAMMHAQHPERAVLQYLVFREAMQKETWESLTRTNGVAMPTVAASHASIGLGRGLGWRDTGGTQLSRSGRCTGLGVAGASISIVSRARGPLGLSVSILSGQFDDSSGTS